MRNLLLGLLLALGLLFNSGESARSANNVVVDSLVAGFGSYGISTRKIAVVSGVIRNFDDGQGWRLISDSLHDNINISTVTNDTATISVNWAGLSVKKVLAFTAVADETLAKAHMFMGTSVGLSGAGITIKRLRQVADYVSWSGSAFASSADVFTQTSFTDGVLTLTHEGVLQTSNGVVAQVTGRGGIYVPQLGSAVSTTTTLTFHDWAGAVVTTGNGNMKAYVNRGFASASENPNDINQTTFNGANIWVIGVLEIN